MRRYPMELVPTVDLETAQPDKITPPWPQKGFLVFISRPSEYSPAAVAWFSDRNPAFRFAAELSTMTDDVRDVVHVSKRARMFDKPSYGQVYTLARFRNGEYEPKEGRAPTGWVFGKAGRYEY